MQQSRARKSRGSLIFLTILVVVLGVTWLERQAVYDWFRLHDYTPPVAISQLASDTTMNGSAQHIFYVQHPELDDKSTFQTHCQQNSEQTIVLGCYISHQGIYVLEVDDSRLTGVEQVTAAHEMLHAAYDRLSAKDKANVDNLINQAYAQVTDPRIRQTIADYQKAGADVTNELHSILGTEVANLPPALETYYQRYFTDRAKIVAYSQEYEKAFSDRKAQADSYLAQIKDIERQLASLQAQIESEETNLRQENAALEADRANVTDVNAFNARVNSYNAQVRSYQADVAQYNDLVAQHNQLYNQYKAVVLEENQLVKALDSRSTNVSAQ